MWEASGKGIADLRSQLQAAERKLIDATAEPGGNKAAALREELEHALSQQKEASSRASQYGERAADLSAELLAIEGRGEERSKARAATSKKAARP